MERVQQAYIARDLAKKMVFITGSRQSGKTWLARHIAQDYSHPTYLNYDNIKDQKIITEQAWIDTTDLLILDELYKMPNWKNYLKGLFDTKQERLQILVTGSARLDIYNQMGDSLAGRYFTHRLLPFTAAELSQVGASYDLDKLIQRGGFPEPFLAETDTDAARWRNQYVNSLITIDALEIERIQNLKNLRLVLDLLRYRVGSPISYQSIAEDVKCSLNTVKRYIQILEALYIIFRVSPFSNNIARSILKEPKIYFFDIGLVAGDVGAKFENLMAVSLLKHAYAKQDYYAEDFKLHYLRTKDKQEVDFALVNNNSIELIIEAKVSDTTISKSLQKFQQKYGLEAVQIVKNLRQEYMVNGIKVLQAQSFLEGLLI